MNYAWQFSSSQTLSLREGMGPVDRISYQTPIDNYGNTYRLDQYGKSH